MAHLNALFLVLTVALIMPNAITSTRDLATRLHLQESHENTTKTDCWAALSELKSCSNEIIGFFLNGQTDIDTPCCLAIEVITKNCWPSMLSILGISAEEGHVLAGYCDTNKFSAAAGSPPHSDGTLG